jgi:preprotein translocase subunit SecA
MKKDPNIAVEVIATHIKNKGLNQYREKEKMAGKEALQHFERSIMLQIFDHHWRAHLSSLDNLRQGIQLRAYGQKDPKQEFKKEAFGLFEQLLETIKFEITRVLMLVIVKDEDEAKKIDKKNQQAIEASNPRNQASQSEQNKQMPDKKVGRNEPCPCGSGKKFKHCCGALN